MRLRVLCTLAFVCVAARLGAQGSADVPLGDNAYVYLDALLARGALRSLSALERPYNVAQIATALRHQMPATASSVVRSYERALRRALAKYDVGGLLAPTRPAPGLHYQIGAELFGTAQSSSIRDLMRANTDKGLEPGGGAFGALQVGPLTAVAHPILDSRLHDDPEYNLYHRADYIRIDEGYVDARWRYAELFVGREGRSSGPTMFDGLLLGNYAYSYDHLWGQIGIPQIHMQVLVTRLNDEFFGDTARQRYFSWHRLASHVGGFEFALEESIVYGREGQSYDLHYVNPFGLYYFSEINELQGGADANKMVGWQAAWRSPAGTFSVEGHIDDIQAFGGCSNTDSLCKKPPSGGWTIQADGIPFVGDQRLFAAYTLVSNLSYRDEQPWTSYTSYGVSLGRGYSDYDEARLGVDLALVPAVPLKVYGAFSRQGQGDYRLPHPQPSQYSTTPTFLDGVVSRVYRAGVSGAVSLPWLDVSGDVGVNHVTNWQHVTGVDKTVFASRIKVALIWARIVGGTTRPPAPDDDSP